MERTLGTRLVLVPCVGFGAVLEVGIQTVHSFGVGSVCRFGGCSTSWSQTMHSSRVGSVCRLCGLRRDWSQNCAIVLC